MPQMNEKAANLQYDKSAKKLGANKVDEIMCQWCLEFHNSQKFSDLLPLLPACFKV